MNQPQSVRPLKRLVALVLAACLFSSTTGLQAAERKGAGLQIDMRDGSKITGELLQVQDGGLKILDASTHAYVVVTLTEVRSVKIVKKSMGLLGAAVGLLGGAVAGGVIGLAEDDGGWFTGGGWIVAWAAFVGHIGAAVGAIAGAIKGADEFVGCDGRTPKELAEILVKMEGYARFPKNAAVAATMPAVQKLDVPATEVAPPPTAPSLPTTTPAAAEPATNTTSSSGKFRRVHVGLGFNYVTSAGVGTLKDVMRSVGFDHQNKTCLWGLCNTADYPRVWKDTKLVSDVRIDYSLNNKWAVGLAYSPIGSHGVTGREEVLNMDDRPTYPPFTALATEYSGQTLAVTASLFPVPDAFLKKDTVRASLGVGVSRIKTSLRGGPNAEYPMPDYLPDEHLAVRESQKTVPAIVASVDWIRFFNRTLSLNVGVQYRYVPFTLGPETVSAAYYYYPAVPPLGTGALTWDAVSVAIPKRTVNAGGIGIGMGFGFHW